MPVAPQSYSVEDIESHSRATGREERKNQHLIQEHTQMDDGREKKEMEKQQKTTTTTTTNSARK